MATVFNSVVLLLTTLATSVAGDRAVLRVGHFPNVTHVQGLVAHHLSRQGQGWFEPRLGPGVKIQWFTYNAGPSAMEAIFANSIDLAYVGPGPALNAYAKSQGQEIRLLAGSANGGAALVVQPDAPLKVPADFKGKKIATPQLGNTQDIACRAWLASGGLKITQLGGDAQVLPTHNPDQLSLFQQKKLDAVWTVEPWVSRLEREAGGKVLLEQPDAVTTVLVARVSFLKQKRELAEKFVQAHRELTDWILRNPEPAQRMARTELLRTGRSAEVHALDAVSLQVGQGDFVCLVGPSGCGKSTLLNILAGLEKPDSGQVLADGQPITEPGRDRMMMFQESALFPWLDVMGNVLFGLKLKPGLKAKERREVAEFYLHLVGLGNFMHANLHQLSGGMKQRVALARALAPNPRVLLMDEPFAALDALTRERLYGDLQRVWQMRKKTILFVTHNVREAACLGNRVVLFSPHPGRIREEFTIDLERPRDINSVRLATHATEIMRALKGHVTSEGVAE